MQSKQNTFFPSYATPELDELCFFPVLHGKYVLSYLALISSTTSIKDQKEYTEYVDYLMVPLLPSQTPEI